jgi:hypothetical protein
LFYSLAIKINLSNSLKIVPKISFAGRSSLSCSKTIITEDETRGKLQQTTATIRQNREN